MNSSNSIGGFFELELSKGSLLHSNVILLQSARACLEYLIHSLSINKIYIPKYTCNVILQPIQKNNIRYEFYNVDNNLEIDKAVQLGAGDYLLYTNYFGIKDTFCNELSEKYKDKLILDCSQAYFYDNYKESHIIYSPRKFFGVPDGGELYTKKYLDKDLNQDISYDRALHLLKRIDLGPESGYEDFKKNDETLDNQPIRLMSNLTRRILESVDYEKVANVRRSNFNYLRQILNNLNKIKPQIVGREVPMCYPYISDNQNLKNCLIKNKIYIPTYWPNVYDWTDERDYERFLADNLMALPIDQRYNTDDMDIILRTIDECRN